MEGGLFITLFYYIQLFRNYNSEFHLIFLFFGKIKFNYAALLFNFKFLHS